MKVIYLMTIYLKSILIRTKKFVQASVKYKIFVKSIIKARKNKLKKKN